MKNKSLSKTVFSCANKSKPKLNVTNNKNTGKEDKPVDTLGKYLTT
jgi:hypothetical protein